jgi:uncharacterized protein (DUF2235 family)
MSISIPKNSDLILPLAINKKSAVPDSPNAEPNVVGRNLIVCCDGTNNHLMQNIGATAYRHVKRDA